VVKGVIGADNSVVATRPLEGRWPMSVEIESKNRVVEFARNHAHSWLKLDLLYFWSRYPYAKFTAGIITQALGSNRRIDVEEALDSMVKENLVDKHVDKGLPFYCLTSDASKRECVLKMPAYRSSLRPALSMG
jgi:hypothetical protein